MNQLFQKSVLITLALYLGVGILLSILTGISHDEFHEQLNWEVNLKSIKDFLTTGKYNDLLSYKDRYYGIGFHFITQPFQIFIYKPLSNFLSISEYGAILISKHIFTFLIFFVSGIFIYLITKLLFKDKIFATISLFIYLLYPYLFGHAQFNPKDIPFLSLWVICSYFVIKIIKKLLDKKNIKLKYFILFALFSALLVSIRTVGLLIYLQLLIFLFVYFENKNEKILKILKENRNKIYISIGLILVLIYFFNPIFWHNPIEFINSIKSMSKFQQDVCTITLGECIKSLNLPASYYFIWFFFKLPILIIIGIFLFPLIDAKLSKNQFAKIIIVSLIFTFSLILLLFILFNVAIYDEIRHIMFLVPLIFLVSLCNLYVFNKKIFTALGIILITFFVLENFSLNPYQYTWLNSFAKFHKINKSFEVDYWGLSGKNLNLKIKDHAFENNFDKKNCIYSGGFSEVFLKKEGFECFKSYSELDAAKNRPFYVVKNVRNFKRSNPKDCELIGREKFNYTFFNQNIYAGTAWYCN